MVGGRIAMSVSGCKDSFESVKHVCDTEVYLPYIEVPKISYARVRSQTRL